MGSTDRGFTLGDGLFETLLSLDGELVDWPAHFERLRHGSEVLGLPAPEEALCLSALRVALTEAGAVEGRAAARLSWSGGEGGRGLDRPEAPRPQLSATATSLPAAAGVLSLATVSVRRNEGSPASRLKTLAYLDNVLARREARDAGADEALMLNNRGQIACAAAGNLFWQVEGELYTPALECGVLGGVVRARVLAATTVREVEAGLEVLDEAEAVVFTNSLAGVRPVSSVDERRFDSVATADALARLIGWEG